MTVRLPATGTRFGRLAFLGPTTRTSHWWFQCDCNSEPKEIRHHSVRKGLTHSCGCYRNERTQEACGTHSMSRTKIYRLWSMMHDRCRNPRNLYYATYGKRGIAVCSRWHDFGAFYADMGERPSGLTLNRIDNDGPYSPENCEWASAVTQGRNRTNNKLLTFQGKTQPLSAWAEELGLNYNTLNTRVQRGWSDDRVLATPVKKVSVAWRVS